jgi:hypothetical protein
VKFRHDVSIFRAEILVFIDETGSDRRDTMRKFGYSLRGNQQRPCMFTAEASI